MRPCLELYLGMESGRLRRTPGVGILAEHLRHDVANCKLVTLLAQQPLWILTLGAEVIDLVADLEVPRVLPAISARRLRTRTQQLAL